MRLRQKIYRWILFDLLGWSIEGRIPHEEKRLLAVVLPHTSNWDFVIGWLFVRAENITVTIFGKDQFHFFPFNYAYKYFRIVPISRKKSQNFVKQAAALYDNGAELWTAMAPEGTRSYQDHLRSGYYYFAREADIPLLTAGMDFPNKRLIVEPLRKVKPTFEEDSDTLKEFAARCKGKRPSLSIS